MATTFLDNEKNFFWVYAAFLLLFLWWMPEGVHDDKVARTLFCSPEWLLSRYREWSSRLLIEAWLPALCRHVWLFKGLTFCVGLLIPWLLARLVVERPEDRPRVYGVCFLYGMLPMGSAGWVTTIVNYYYVLFALLAAVWLARYGRSAASLAALVVTALYAANHEQGCLILLGAMGAVSCLGAGNRRTFGVLALACASLLFIATAPGNELRYYSEVKSWFPNFLELSFPYKIYLGFSSTLFHYVLAPHPASLFLLLCIFLCRTGSAGKSLLLAVGVFLIQLLCMFLVVGGPGVAFVRGHPVYLSDFSSVTFLGGISLLAAIGALIFVCASLCRIFSDRASLFRAFFILAAGLGTRMLMGLSPTLFISSSRTFLFCDFALLALSLMLLARCDAAGKARLIWYVMPFSLALNYVVLA